MHMLRETQQLWENSIEGMGGGKSASVLKYQAGRRRGREGHRQVKIDVWVGSMAWLMAKRNGHLRERISSEYEKHMHNAGQKSCSPCIG